MQVLSPCAGRVFPITEVSDPVFAGQMVGPGIALEPLAEQMFVVCLVNTSQSPREGLQSS